MSFLAANHCDEMQGYYFSCPLTAQDCTALLREGRRLVLPAHRGEANQPTLLLVDDDVNTLAALKRLLRTDGYRILTATGAKAGMELLATNPVGVVISDQRMPEMTGVEFLKRVKDLYPETVRIVLSGYADLQSVTDAINQGAVYKFLSKPCDEDQLLASIREAFRRRELALENDCLNGALKAATTQLARVNAELQERREEHPNGDNFVATDAELRMDSTDSGVMTERSDEPSMGPG
jgi:response regulator RpfG family c-di-GMP phosphodiesterase